MTAAEANKIACRSPTKGKGEAMTAEQAIDASPIGWACRQFGKGWVCTDVSVPGDDWVPLYRECDLEGLCLVRTDDADTSPLLETRFDGSISIINGVEYGPVVDLSDVPKHKRVYWEPAKRSSHHPEKRVVECVDVCDLDGKCLVRTDDERVKELEAEVGRLKALIIRDRKGEVVSQGAFNLLLDGYERRAKKIAEAKQQDDPEWDGTDAAHPAWWRGQEAGVESICRLIGRILDGEPIAGVACEPWESTRRRLADLKQQLAEARQPTDDTEPPKWLNPIGCLRYKDDGDIGWAAYIIANEVYIAWDDADCWNVTRQPLEYWQLVEGHPLNTPELVALFDRHEAGGTEA